MSAPTVSSRYLQINVQNGDWKKEILAVAIVVHTEGRWEMSDFSNNHVTQYLAIQGDRSIQINMRHAAEDDINGRLEIVSRNYPAETTRSLITNLDLQTAATRPTVQQAVDAITGSNPLSSAAMNDFCFAGGGMGCRYWHTTIACLYEVKGFVPEGSAFRVFDFLSWMYTKTPNVAPVPTNIRPGTFDSAQVQQMVLELWRNRIMHPSRQLFANQTSYYDTLRSIAAKSQGQQYSPEERAVYDSLRQQGHMKDYASFAQYQQQIYQAVVAAQQRDQRVGEVIHSADALFVAREAGG